MSFARENDTAAGAAFWMIVSAALLTFFVILLIAVFAADAHAIDAITANADSVVRTLDYDIWGFTGNGWYLANGSRSDMDGDGAIDTPAETFGSGYNYTNFTLMKSTLNSIFMDSRGRVSYGLRQDLAHAYCMADNATGNNHCNQANPQSMANTSTMYEYLDALNGTVTVTVANLYSRYDDGDTSFDCSASGLRCPPDSYSYRATTLISALKLSGICPEFCTGIANRTLIMSQWNEPYNQQYWLDDYARANNASTNEQRNCTSASVVFMNFVERDYAALETARIREGYHWNWSTPSWPVRTSAESFNDCGVYMQDLFNVRFSPSLNGTVNWTYYEVHPYDSNTTGYTRLPAHLHELEINAELYGYTQGIITETAANNIRSGQGATGENATYLNNSYMAMAVNISQGTFWKKVNWFTFWHSYDCSNIDGGNPEFTHCFYAFSEREGLKGMGYAVKGIVDCHEGGSTIYSTSTTNKKVFASLAKLRNGTYCLMTGHAGLNTNEAVNVTFTGDINVTKMVNVQNGTQITVTNNFATLPTYRPGDVGLYYLDANATGGGGEEGGGGSYNGTMPIMVSGRVLISSLGRLVLG